MTSHSHIIIQKWYRRTVFHESVQILMDFLCHSRWKHSGIRSRISNQFLLIEFLYHPQCLVRTDFKPLGTFILKFRQVKQQWWILLFFFLFNGFDPIHTRLFLFQIADQFLRGFFFLESIFLVKKQRRIILWTFYCLPFAFQLLPIHFYGTEDTVKRSLYKFTDFPFSADNHAKYTGHNSSYRNNRILFIQIIRYTVTVFQCQKTWKINSHQIILFGTQISRCRQIIIFWQILCLSDPAQNFFFCLGINPDS